MSGFKGRKQRIQKWNKNRSRNGTRTDLATLSDFPKAASGLLFFWSIQCKKCEFVRS